MENFKKLGNVFYLSVNALINLQTININADNLTGRTYLQHIHIFLKFENTANDVTNPTN